MSPFVLTLYFRLGRHCSKGKCHTIEDKTSSGLLPKPSTKEVLLMAAEVKGCRLPHQKKRWNPLVAAWSRDISLALQLMLLKAAMPDAYTSAFSTLSPNDHQFNNEQTNVNVMISNIDPPNHESLT